MLIKEITEFLIYKLCLNRKIVEKQQKKEIHENKKCVNCKAFNLDTNEINYYNSLYAVNQHLNINAGIVSMICQGINNCKSAISKIDNHKYKFEFIDKNDLPENYKKSANIRPKMSPEEKMKKQESSKKWCNKYFKCNKCGKTLKNSYKCLHKKYCKKVEFIIKEEYDQNQ